MFLIQSSRQAAILSSDLSLRPSRGHRGERAALRVIEGGVEGARRPSARGSGGAVSHGRFDDVRFRSELLPVPSVVRPEHEPDVLYVRLGAPLADGAVAVLPDAAAEIRRAVAAARQAGGRVMRAVLVGADSFLAAPGPASEGADIALQALVDAIGALADERVPFVWRTRAGIDAALPPTLAAALSSAQSLAVVEIGVPSVDEELAHALEGGASAPVAHRLRLATALVSRGVLVRALVDPLVPMLTDQQGPLESLIAALAEAGVTRLGGRYIVLTRERARILALRLAGMQRALLQGVFAEEPWRKPSDAEGARREVHKKIPAALRRQGHHRLLEIGARHGLMVEILDPVEDGEDSVSDLPHEAPPPRRQKRAEPQLELFRRPRG